MNRNTLCVAALSTRSPFRKDLLTLALAFGLTAAFYSGAAALAECNAQGRVKAVRALGFRGQSGRKVQTIDLRPLSCIVLVSVEEYSEGRVVKGREFKYPVYFTDDGRPATLSPVVSAVKLKSARVSYLDRLVTSDPFADLVWRLDGDDPGLEVIPVYAVSDPRTGLPDHKVGSRVVRDKNGNGVIVAISVRYRNWKRRAVEVRELPDEGP